MHNNKLLRSGFRFASTARKAWRYALEEKT